MKTASPLVLTVRNDLHVNGQKYTGAVPGLGTRERVHCLSPHAPRGPAPPPGSGRVVGVGVSGVGRRQDRNSNSLQFSLNTLLIAEYSKR